MNQPGVVSSHTAATTLRVVFLCRRSAPVRLMLVMLVCDLASLLCLAGIVTAFLTPVFWIGYNRYLHGLLKQTSPSFRDLIVFMRHGWDSLWHLAMLFAAMIVTVSLVLCAAMLCLLLLCSIYAGVVALAAFSGDADVPDRADHPRLILRDPQDAPGLERGDHVEGIRTGWWHSLANWWSRHFWDLVAGLLTIPMFFGRTLVSLLLLDVALAQRREGPERFDAASDAFGHMLDASRRNWGRLLLEGAGLYLLFTFVAIGIPMLIALLGIAGPHSVLTQDLLRSSCYRS